MTWHPLASNCAVIANQPKSDHDNGLPNVGLTTGCLQPNGADHGECRLLITHLFWNLGDKVLERSHTRRVGRWMPRGRQL